jgi:hypothetical protein
LTHSCGRLWKKQLLKRNTIATEQLREIITVEIWLVKLGAGFEGALREAI